MAKVEIVRSLLIQIKKKFKGESHKIIDLIETSRFVFAQSPYFSSWASKHKS